MRAWALVLAVVAVAAACAPVPAIAPARLGVDEADQAPAPVVVDGATAQVRLTWAPAARRLQGVVPAKARVVISGPDLATPYERDLPASGTATLDAVPVGPRRLITIEGLDAAGKALPQARARWFGALAAGDNAVAVTPTTGLVGEVYAALLAASPQLAGTVDPAALATGLAAYPAALGVASPRLLDVPAIAAALATAAGKVPAPEPRFALRPGRLAFIPVGWPRRLTATATLDDPLSAPWAFGDRSGVVDGIPPGTWTLTVTPDQPGFEPWVKPVTITAGGTATVELPLVATKALPDLPQPVAAAAYAGFGAAAGEGLAVVGGMTRRVPAGGIAPETGPSLALYRFTAGAWTKGADLPAETTGLVPVVHAGALYMLGAFGSLRLDPIANGVALRAPGQVLPTPEPSPSAPPSPIASGSPGPVASGSPDPGATDVPPPAPQGFVGGSAASLGGQVYMTGGTFDGFPLGDLLRIDPATGATAFFDDARLPLVRSEMAGAVLDGRWYLAGGREPSAYLGTVYRDLVAFEPREGETPARFRPLPGMPTARSGAAGLAAFGRVWVIGGYDASGQAVASVESFDPKTQAWRIHPPLRQARAAAAAGVVGGKIVVAGGAAGDPASLATRLLATVEEVTP